MHNGVHCCPITKNQNKFNINFENFEKKDINGSTMSQFKKIVMEKLKINKPIL